MRWLGAVGLNALPLWCAPFHTLSTGEGARAVLARQLRLGLGLGLRLRLRLGLGLGLG